MKSTKVQVVGGSLAGAVVIHVCMVACFGPGVRDVSDGGVLDAMFDAARDAIDMDLSEAHAQDATGGCNCGALPPQFVAMPSGVGITAPGTRDMWVDVPSLSVSLNLPGMTTFDVMAHGVGISSGSTGQTAACGYRLVLDGVAFDSSVLRIPAGVDGPGNQQIFLMTNRVQVPAGQHTIRVQLAQLGGDGICAVQSGGGRLWVTQR